MVVSKRPIEGQTPLLWVLMITSAANRGWPYDVSLEERFSECGLAVPCLIRTAKISTVEAGRGRKTGKLPPDLLKLVQAKFASHVGL